MAPTPKCRLAPNLFDADVLTRGTPRQHDANRRLHANCLSWHLHPRLSTLRGMREGGRQREPFSSSDWLEALPETVTPSPSHRHRTARQRRQRLSERWLDGAGVDAGENIVDGDSGSESSTAVENQVPLKAVAASVDASVPAMLLEMCRQLGALRGRVTAVERESRGVHDRLRDVQDKTKRQLGALRVAVDAAAATKASTELSPPHAAVIRDICAAMLDERLAANSRTHPATLAADTAEQRDWSELRLAQAVDVRFHTLEGAFRTELERVEQTMRRMERQVAQRGEGDGDSEPVRRAIDTLRAELERAQAADGTERWERWRRPWEQQMWRELDERLESFRRLWREEMREELERWAEQQAVAARRQTPPSADTPTAIALDALRSLSRLQSSAEKNARTVEQALRDIRASNDDLHERVHHLERSVAERPVSHGKADDEAISSLASRMERLEERWERMASASTMRAGGAHAPSAVPEQARRLDSMADTLAQLRQRLEEHGQLCNRLQQQLQHRTQGAVDTARLDVLEQRLQQVVDRSASDLAALQQCVTDGDRSVQAWTGGQVDRLTARLQQHESGLKELRDEVELLFERYARIAAVMLGAWSWRGDLGGAAAERVQSLFPGGEAGETHPPSPPS